MKKPVYKPYKKINIRIVERGQKSKLANAKKGKYIELTGATKQGKIIRRIYTFDQLQPLDTNRLDLYIKNMNQKIKGEKVKRITEKYIQQNLSKTSNRKKNEITRSTGNLLKQIQKRPSSQDSIERGQNQLKKPISLTILGQKEKQNNVLNELLSPLVKHEGIRELLLQNQELWKKYLTYDLRINTEQEDGSIKANHGQIEDNNKTLTEYYNEYTNADYVIDGDLWQKSQTTKIESDTSIPPLKIRTTMYRNQERIGQHEKHFPIKALLLMIKISKTKPRYLLT